MSRVRFLTTANEAYARVLKVLLLSIERWGGGEAVEGSVCDIGLSSETRHWVEGLGYSITETAPAFPCQPWIIDPWYRTLVTMASAITDEIKALDDEDVFVFLASDLCVMPTPDGADPYLQTIIDAARNHEGPVGTHDAHTFAVSDKGRYVNDQANATDADFWRKWFDYDLTKSPIWNTGVVAGRAKFLKPLCDEWMDLCLRWATDEDFHDAFSGLAIEQLAWSVLLEKRETGEPYALPPTFNLTRLLWHWQPELIPYARAIHLTGPAKPWCAGSDVYPLTMRWLDVEGLFRQEGLLDAVQ